MTIAIFLAKYLFLLPPALLCGVFLKAAPAERRTLAIQGVIVLVTATLLAKIGGALYNEPRPFVVQHVRPWIPHAADSGFPSDHTLTAACCALLCGGRSRPAMWVGLLAALTVGIARVLCRLHTPLDIAGSFTFALVSLGLARQFSRFPTGK